jgi:hypothetical protein
MSVQVVDPFGLVDEPALAAALDPATMCRRFASADFRPSRAGEAVVLRAIRAVRHKPGQRYVIEYDVEVASAGKPMTIIGKVRTRHPPRTTYRLVKRLREAGFSDESADGIAVPKPLGVFAELGMWLQRKVPGRRATELLLEPRAIELMVKIAEAAHKLHCAKVPAKRTHTMADELRILRERLSAVAQEQPRLAGRIGRLLAACERIGAP